MEVVQQAPPEHDNVPYVVGPVQSANAIEGEAQRYDNEREGHSEEDAKQFAEHIHSLPRDAARVK
jgi:hypothetical protein